MTLTLEQKRDLQQGRAVSATLDGIECVLLARDVYDRVRQLFDIDESSWTPEERGRLLESFGEKAGWDDPALDVYEQYRQA